MEKIILRRTSRVLKGHLWIFSNELLVSPKRFSPGSIVKVYDSKDSFLGIGYINPNSLICIRLLTRKDESIDSDFFYRRIVAAIRYREKYLPSIEAIRVIFSESDFLPGLIVDRYADCLVVQILTLGMEQFKDKILEILDNIFSPSTIVLRNDSPIRMLEGLPLYKKIVKGYSEPLPVIKEFDLFFEIDPLKGQKTGFFLDQRDNRIALRNYIKGGTGLDLFCYSGSWALHLAKEGSFVKCVDDSELALSMAERNFKLNKLISSCELIKQDVFDFLRQELESKKLYDFIVLDPPAFVKSKGRVKEALRGYREINSLVMRLIRNGGIMATSSCSYHIDRAMFIEMLIDAAKDAGRTVKVLEYRTQGKDHPILLSVPETEYLKCFFLEVQ
jgi:23S rRNA (cytosine1962-C5)-methyltransferase